MEGIVNYIEKNDKYKNIFWKINTLIIPIFFFYYYYCYCQFCREYYRCTNGKGCLARKQVQRSDEDPTAYEVTYKGLHTCHNNPPTPIIQPQNELKTPLSYDNQINQSQQEPFLNIQTSLTIIDSGHDKQYDIPSSSNSNPKNNPMVSDDQPLWEDYFLDFMYPTAPEFNNFNNIVESAAKPPTQDVDSSFDRSSGQHRSSFGLGNSSYFPWFSLHVSILIFGLYCNKVV